MCCLPIHPLKNTDEKPKMKNIYAEKNNLRIRSNTFSCVVMYTYWKCYPAVYLMKLYWGKKEKDAGVANVSSTSSKARVVMIM